MENTIRLAYLTVMRMPTEMANGLQVMKTCSAITSAGIDLTLFNGTRYQITRSLKDVDPFTFYDLDNKFELKRVPYLDTQPLANYIGPLIRPARILSNALFPLAAELYIRRWKPSIVYTRHWLAARWLSKRGIPTAFELHEANTTHFSSRAVESVAKMTHTPSLKFVATISHGLKSSVVEAGGLSEKIYVVPDAVDLSNYNSASDRKTIRANLGIIENKPVAVYTGGAAPGKGVEVLLNAARLEPGVEFYVVGVSSQNLERIVTTTPVPSNVNIVKRVDASKAAQYQLAADMLLLPQESLQSQSPLKLYEYIAAGQPIIATNLEPIREVLEHEKSALLATPSSHESFAEQINKLKSNPDMGRTLAANAQQRIGNWSWERRGEQIADLVRASL